MSNQTFHKIILSKLIQDDEYFRSTLPYLKKEYFEDRSTSILFELISEYAQTYKKPPSLDVLKVNIEDLKGLTQPEHDEVSSLLKEVSKEKHDVDHKWLMDSTEKYCQERAIFLAIMDAVSIIDGSDKKRAPGVIPSLLSEALAVSFDKNIGHDYFADMESRWDFYNSKEAKIPSLVKIFDKVMNGGVPKKTLNLIMGFQHAGKSAVLCSLAASYVSQGYNVLYITLELAEERIAERIDANLLNIPMHQVAEIPKDLFCKRINKLKEKTFGKFKIKEYPGSTATADNFRALLDELKMKQDFDPDIIMIDYLGICASGFYRAGSNANSYTIQKSISEELRALAVERDKVVWSAVQGNRGSANNSDMDATNIADSIGVMMTADLCFGVIRTPELDDQGQALIKQIKNRYGDCAFMNRFVIGFDRARMKLYDIDDQSGIVNEQSNPDHSYMDRVSQELQSKKSEETSNSSGWDFS